MAHSHREQEDAYIIINGSGRIMSRVTKLAGFRARLT
jgi:hypothetical protein